MESDLLHDRTSHDSIQTNSVMAQYDYGSVCHPYRRRPKRASSLLITMSVEMSATLLHWNGTSKPVTYMSTDLIPPGELRSFATVEVTVPIEDARSLLEQPTLNSAGYELLQAPTPLSTAQFYDADVVTTRYYDECCELLKTFTSAEKVVRSGAGTRVRRGARSKTQLVFNSSGAYTVLYDTAAALECRRMYRTRLVSAYPRTYRRTAR